ncbi:hypothetical protein FOPG_01786 [Fusarium oxysporum f. sp. conglutinans race 2 54008]|uniref:Uncharacterized protein n=1 Tax=Fusarium oxysporum f. sp. conglutinans race 2 54008 TaxID=1089457 RepID=X0JPK3_FUSOX|nr:hypothetical protein FOPG_01786 [Fusarium oxysporum f. sp. conglutinans race 2 54008]
MLMLDTSIPSFHPSLSSTSDINLFTPLQLFTLTSSPSLTYLLRITLPHILALPSYLALRRSCLPIELLRVLSLPHPPPLPSLPISSSFHPLPPRSPLCVEHRCSPSALHHF